MNSPLTKRNEASQQRRQAILDAALDVFAADGFAAARLEDVAAKAGVAKGTIYLSFKDKEDLFEQIFIGALVPVLQRIETIAAEPSLSFDATLALLYEFFETEVLETKRREIIRLVLTEGQRFPRIAETYHREVISKGLKLLERIARNAHEQGALTSSDLIRFPHLVFSPLLLALLWNSLFSKYQTLDVHGLLEAHRRLLVADGGARPRERRA
jgi:AcrR family transcriptional regulator